MGNWKIENGVERVKALNEFRLIIIADFFIIQTYLVKLGCCSLTVENTHIIKLN